jgi:penicillin-binding protein 2
LRGKDGYFRRIVDSLRRIEGEEIGQKPIAGKNIVLTIDYEIQKTLYEAIGNYRGAAVVLKPATGEVLAMVSKPDFDPNAILSKNNDEVISTLINNPDRPFINRAIQALYPPASTFKLVTAVAGLEEDKWKAGRSNYCPGKYILKGYRKDITKYCYGVHHHVDLYSAIAKSCSTYFYNMSYKIGPTVIMKYAKHFGLNAKTGIDLPGEKSGFIPSKKWKRRRFGQSWYDGDTINLSIGQGFTMITPIELATFVAAINNNGIMYRPHLIKEIRSQDNRKIIEKVAPKRIKEIPLSEKTLDAIRYGMRMAVTKGTSVRLRYLKVPIAGKTGTAQTKSKRDSDATQHAWFTGFAPFKGGVHEKVVIAVIVEHGVAGAATAVPIAEKVFYKMTDLGYFSEYSNKRR